MHIRLRLITTILLASCASFADKDNIPDNYQDVYEENKGSMYVMPVAQNTIRNEWEERTVHLKFNTKQHADIDKRDCRLRVTIELTDKKTGKTGFAQRTDDIKGLSFAYENPQWIRWEFEMPHGTFGRRTQVSAYAIEYGLIKDDVFIPIHGQYDDVDSAQEITDRTQIRIKGLRRTERGFFVSADPP